MGTTFFTTKIPIISSTITYRLELIKKNEFCDFLNQARKLTVYIMSQILFGKDFFEKINFAKYKTEDGYEQISHFCTIFPKTVQDLEEEQYEFKAHLFQYLAENSAINPFKRNMYNVCELWRILTDFVNISSDRESIYSILKSTEEYSNNQAFHDCISMLFSAYETIPHALCTILYQTRKDEEIYSQLKKYFQHLNESFFKVDGELIKENIDN